MDRLWTSTLTVKCQSAAFVIQEEEEEEDDEEDDSVTGDTVSSVFHISLTSSSFHIFTF